MTMDSGTDMHRAMRCLRKSDASVVQGAMGDAAKAFKSAMGKEVKLELDKENLPAKVAFAQSLGITDFETGGVEGASWLCVV